MRIRVLQSAYKKAGRLFNTGAYPQATYGKEAYGVSPGEIRTLRGLAAQAGGGGGGKCSTTLIWLLMGLQNDPAIRIPKDQVRTWLFLESMTDEKVKLSRAWWLQKGRFHGSPSP